MSKLKKDWLEDNAVDGSKIKLDNNQYLKARNAADSADINIVKVNGSDQIELASAPYVGSDKVQTAADKGVANGIAPLNGSSKIDATYLPSYVDDVEEYANLAAFPVTGETGKIYVAINTNKTYRWTGSVYVEISPSEVNSVNGFTGVVVLDTDDISEGSNLYFTEARVLGTDLAGLSLASSADITSADTVLSAFGKLQAQLDLITGADAHEQTFTLGAGDITNGYVDLAFVAMTESIHVTPKGGLLQTLTDDYTISYTGGAGGVTRITFAGDLASTLVAGHKLMVKYFKA